MKVLFANDNYAAPFYIRTGQSRAFAACSHHTVMWDLKQKPAFDAFNELEPDIFIGQTYNIDRATAKCIAARPHMKVALFASANGELARTIDRKRFPIDIASENEIIILEKLKKETGKPDVVFIHCADRFVQQVLGGWRDIGIEPIGLMNGADIFSYLGGRYKPEYACDIGYVGGLWNYKASAIRPLFLPLCYEAKHKIKVFGNAHWNIAQYLGGIAEEEVKNLFASALVCPNFSEPHSVEYGIDIVERCLKIPLSGFLISDNVASLKEDIFIDGECPTFSSASELADLVDYWTDPKQGEARWQLMERQKACILNNHSYFHRCSKLLYSLGLNEQGKAMLDSYANIIQKISNNHYSS